MGVPELLSVGGPYSVGQGHKGRNGGRTRRFETDTGTTVGPHPSPKDNMVKDKIGIICLGYRGTMGTNEERKKDK